MSYSMRQIDLIVIHCSASDVPSHDDISVVDDWHKDRGFRRIDIPYNATNKTDRHVGYHFFITKKGTVQTGRDLREIGAHCKNFNARSIGICFSGNDLFTEEQFIAGRKLLIQLVDLYNLELKDILPHNKLDRNKSCPRFDVEEKLLKDLFH